MRIAQLVAPAPAGGLERVVRGLASGLSAKGHEVTIVATVPPGRRNHPFLATIGALGLPHEIIEVTGRGYLREIGEVTDRLESWGTEILHTHGYRPDVIGAVAARRAGVAMVATVHGYTGGGLRNRFYEWLQRRAMAFPAAVIAVSVPLMDELRRSGVSESRLHLVRNAWTPSRAELDRTAARSALGIETELPIAGWIGRVTYEKGPDVFLAALRQVAPGSLEARILGDGPERARLEGSPTAVPVRWLGVVPEADRYLKALSLIVQSSRTEGTPMVLLEAMAAGLPIVATAVGGVPDLLGPDEAILVPAEDPSALASAIASVIASPEAARARAERARARLTRDYGVEGWLAAHERVYRRALNGTGG
jgi:glycosyltransferase involved in cell wall biosynthesis